MIDKSRFIPVNSRWRLGGDVVDHKFNDGAGFRLGFIAAHGPKTMVFLRATTHKHALAQGGNTLGKRTLLSPASGKFHTGHGTEIRSVSPSVYSVLKSQRN